MQGDLNMPDVAAGCVLLSRSLLLTTITADAGARSVSCEESLAEFAETDKETGGK